MLVLTRKLHEHISIGEDVTITVVRIKGSSVQIGIDAPRSVRVIRGELAAPAENCAPSPPRAQDPAAPGSADKQTPTSRHAGGLAPLVQRISQRCRSHQAPPLENPLDAALAAERLIGVRG